MTVKIKTESELEELLSRPDEETASALAAMDGDLLILGAGGKMGPSLARLARRADRPGRASRSESSPWPDSRMSNLPSEFAAQGIETIACDLLEPRRARQASRYSQCHLHGRAKIRHLWRRTSHLGHEYAICPDWSPNATATPNRGLFHRKCLSAACARGRWSAGDDTCGSGR